MREGWNKQELYPTNETVLPDEPFILIKFKSLVLFFSLLLLGEKKSIETHKKNSNILYHTQKRLWLKVSCTDIIISFFFLIF